MSRFRITLVKGLMTPEAGWQTWESTMEISSDSILGAVEEGEERAKEMDGEIVCVQKMADMGAL
jgi:hypothetical protein